MEEEPFWSLLKWTLAVRYQLSRSKDTTNLGCSWLCIVGGSKLGIGGRASYLALEAAALTLAVFGRRVGNS